MGKIASVESEKNRFLLQKYSILSHSIRTVGKKKHLIKN